MKRILYLSFYFEPDLCAGSFRNSPLAKELAKQAQGEYIIDVVTTLPNRYKTFDADAPSYEEIGNITISRTLIPKHKSGFVDQIYSFKSYFFDANKAIGDKKYDLVFASSSRLFTAYLGYKIAKRQGIPLYLDIRDIFIDTMQDVLKGRALKKGVLPLLKSIENKVFNYATHINLISEGFKEYFEQYKKPTYSFYTNGIDPEFTELPPSKANQNSKTVITYAGNIGEGQGLDKIVPAAAKLLGTDYKFLIIGDGGAKSKLVEEIEKFKLDSVELLTPVSRVELLKIYQSTDFLFLHLNDYPAFEKVLPSKIFELGAYDKPIIAGVGGFASEFIEKYVPNHILFSPCNASEMASKIKKYTYETGFRRKFLAEFTRDKINTEMASSILDCVTKNAIRQQTVR